jgi:hypothetical protein
MSVETPNIVAPELVVVVLSRGRMAGLRRVVNSAIAYAGCPIAVLVMFDADFDTFQAYEPPASNVTKLIYNTRQYYVRGMNKACHILKEKGQDVFCIANNDLEFIKPGWAVLAKNQLFSTFEDGMGVVELSNDGGSFYNFVSRVPFWEEFNGGPQIFDPCYTQYFSDKDLLGRLEKAEKFIHFQPGFTLSHPAYDEIKIQCMRDFFQQDGIQYYRKHPEESRTF